MSISVVALFPNNKSSTMLQVAQVIHVLFIEAEGVNFFRRSHSRDLHIEGRHREWRKMFSLTKARNQAGLCGSLHFEIGYDEVWNKRKRAEDS